MQKPLLEIQDSQGVYESCHPETEVSQIVDFDSHVDGKDNAILNSAKSYADTKKTEAINAASTDATTKANNAKTSAINDAKQYFKNVTTDGAIITITKGDGSTISLTPVLDTPEAHNCIIRGKDLTAQLNNGTLSKNIQNGTFHDIFVGDYFTKSYVVDGTTYNVKWIIVDIDYFYCSGDRTTTAHHVVVMPDSCVQVNVKMNDTNTTSGGFINSKMWKTTIPAHVTGIVSAFGDAHVLQHRELLGNATSDTATSAAGAGWTGASTNWAWCDVKVNIPSEPMIYGGAVSGSSGYDVGNKYRQLAYFRCKPFCMSRQWFWLQAVAGSTNFCLAGDDGAAANNGASHSNSYGGFRPYFLYH